MENQTQVDPTKPTREQMERWDCDGGNCILYDEEIALINGKLYVGKLARVQNALTKSKQKIKKLIPQKHEGNLSTPDGNNSLH